MKCLSAELSAKQAELDAERQGHSVSKAALLAQVGEAEQRKETALAALQEASASSESLKKDCEDIRVLLSSFFFLCFPDL